jgi:hypothetical protein
MKPYEYPETEDEMEELEAWRCEILKRKVKAGKRMPTRTSR